ncbi:hypothetical protein F383_27224 [Gossypium arboreum]|uniref:Uncharacterized protein n=1 Tax=Gossypium arboreum TaxID=29729 RepID=A0A0B0PF24_GOSAR|nr:hypothetical protein F383_27224 [Gossypium arboreum]
MHGGRKAKNPSSCSRNTGNHKISGEDEGDIRLVFAARGEG